MKKVAVIMGSDSDWPVVQGACKQLDEFGIPCEAHILSAHRTPAADILPAALPDVLPGQPADAPDLLCRSAA